MNIIVNKDWLVKGVNNVAKAVSPRPVIPVLGGIKFEANETGVTLTASDSDISISYRIPKSIEDEEIVTITRPGNIVIPAKFFSEIVRRLPGETVSLHVMEHYLTSIVSGSAEFNLHGMDAEEYPRLPQIDEETSFQVSAILLKSLIRRTAFAASTSETRPILTGIQWNLQENNLIFVGTDSHRLAKDKIQVENNSGSAFPSVVVPGKSLNELFKILEDKNEAVEIVVSGNQLLARAENLLFYSRLLDGNYPETSRIIPQQAKTKIVVDTRNLHDALERASLIASRDRNNVVRISTVGDDVIEINSFYPEVGKLSETLPINQIKGNGLKISFNAKYMLDALKVMDNTEVELIFTGEMSPFVIQALGQEDNLHLIVPVRTY